jgi:hypothetical protein
MRHLIVAWSIAGAKALRLERAHTAEKKESNVVSLPKRKR